MFASKALGILSIPEMGFGSSAIDLLGNVCITWVGLVAKASGLG